MDNSRGYEAPMDFEYTSHQETDPDRQLWIHKTKHILEKQRSSFSLQQSAQPSSDIIMSNTMSTVSMKNNHVNGSSDEQQHTPLADHTATWNNRDAPSSTTKTSKNESMKDNLDDGYPSSPSPHNQQNHDKALIFRSGSSKTLAQPTTTTTKKSNHIPEKPRKRRRPIDFTEPNDTINRPSNSGKYHHQRHIPLFKSQSVPFLMMQYLQLFFSLFIMAILCYLIVQFILTVHHDLEMKQEKHIFKITQEISECAKMYTINKCDPETRIPAMENMCQEWTLCMMRDPREVGKLNIGAETMAQVLNQLVDPLSYKTMIVACVMFFGSLWLASSAFVAIKVGTHQRDHVMY